MSRLTREMFCLMEGRHVHPSTLYPGGVGTVPTVQLFTDYLVRLMKYVEFMKKVVPLHDAFGLALSVTLSQGSDCTLPRQECIRACVKTAIADEAIEPGCVPALLLHHLLWRVNQCHGLPRRAPLRQTLLAWIEQLAVTPHTFLGQLAQ